MPTKKKTDEENNSTYGIAAALSEALEAAVFADSTAANKAYSMIEKYAYGEVITEVDDAKMGKKTETMRTTELAMADFTIYDADGTPRVVSIPKITMMPLPLLHVTEATFDIQMSTTLVSSSSSKMNQEPESLPTEETQAVPSRIVRRGTVLVGRRPDGTAVYAMRPTSSRPKDTATDIQPSAADATKMQLAIANTTEESNSSTINMKVNVKLQQAEMPEGIKLLLQAAANSLQVAANGIKEN